MTFWMKDGQLYVNEDGEIMRCGECPCGESDELSSDAGEGGGGDDDEYTGCQDCGDLLPDTISITFPSGWTSVQIETVGDDGCNGPPEDGCTNCASLDGLTLILTRAPPQPEGATCCAVYWCEVNLECDCNPDTAPCVAGCDPVYNPCPPNPTNCPDDVLSDVVHDPFFTNSTTAIVFTAAFYEVGSTFLRFGPGYAADPTFGTTGTEDCLAELQAGVGCSECGTGAGVTGTTVFPNCYGGSGTFVSGSIRNVPVYNVNLWIAGCKTPPTGDYIVEGI